MSKNKVNVQAPESANEQALLSCLLFSINRYCEEPELLLRCQSEGITEEHFTSQRYRELYRAICEERRCSKTGAVNLTGLIVRLNKGGWKKRYGESSEILITKMNDSCYREDLGDHYLNAVINEYKLREIEGTCRLAISKCQFGPDASATDIAYELTSKLMKFGEISGSAPTVASCAPGVFEQLRRQVDTGRTAEDGLSTGYREIDDRLCGLRPGLVIIAARPSVGKTSLAMNIAECVATGKMIDGSPMVNGNEKPQKVVFVTLEMSVRELTERFVLALAKVSRKALAKPMVDIDQRTRCLERIAAVEQEFKTLCKNGEFPIDVIQSESNDIMSIRAQVQRRVARSRKGDSLPVGLVIIDYLQLMTCRSANAGNRQYEVAAISRELKKLSMDLNLPVIALSQLSRPPRTTYINGRFDNGDSGLTLERLRDSGAIEQDADIVMMLDRKLEEKVATLNIAKNRNGETGELKLDFIGESTRFVDHKESAAPKVKSNPKVKSDPAEHKGNSVLLADELHM